MDLSVSSDDEYFESSPQNLQASDVKYRSHTLFTMQVFLPACCLLRWPVKKKTTIFNFYSRKKIILQIRITLRASASDSSCQNISNLDDDDEPILISWNNEPMPLRAGAGNVHERQQLREGLRKVQNKATERANEVISLDSDDESEADTTACPLCGAPVARRDLERHVQVLRAFILSLSLSLSHIVTFC